MKVTKDNVKVGSKVKLTSSNLEDTRRSIDNGHVTLNQVYEVVRVNHPAQGLDLQLKVNPGFGTAGDGPS